MSLVILFFASNSLISSSGLFSPKNINIYHVRHTKTFEDCGGSRYFIGPWLVIDLSYRSREHGPLLWICYCKNTLLSYPAHAYCNGLFTMPDTDSVPNPGTVTIRDPDLDWNLSLCNGNSFCTVQCSNRVWHHYRLQRSWGKVMFLQASVILLTGGVCLSACWDSTPPRTRHPGSRHPPEQTHHPPDPRSRHTPQEQIPPAQSMLGDTVNARAIRILMECKLVRMENSFILTRILFEIRIYQIIHNMILGNSVNVHPTLKCVTNQYSSSVKETVNENE